MKHRIISSAHVVQCGGMRPAAGHSLDHLSIEIDRSSCVAATSAHHGTDGSNCKWRVASGLDAKSGRNGTSEQNVRDLPKNFDSGASLDSNDVKNLLLLLFSAANINVRISTDALNNNR